MASPVELSVILPCYLEEENLRLLLPRLAAVLEGMGVTHEVVVVDTMRPLDNTPEVCAENRVAYVNRAGGDTFGDAVRSGIARARGRRVLFMDADGSHSPEYIPALWREAEGNDVVAASRYVAGGHTENKAVLVLMSKTLNVIYSLILGIRCRDVSNSFKLYDGDLLRSLRLRCSNFDVVEEILVRAMRARPDLRIAEVPFAFKKRMFGETKRNLVLFIITYLFTLVRLRLAR